MRSTKNILWSKISQQETGRTFADMKWIKGKRERVRRGEGGGEREVKRTKM